MPFDMLEAMTLIAREKNIDFDAVVETLEQSLLAAAKKKYASIDHLSFKFDKKNNELIMVATKTVVDKVDDPHSEMTLQEAKAIDPEAQQGDEVDIYLDYEAEFGRNAIASAKQILIQKIREVEHERIYREFIDKVGTLVSGVVQQIDKGNVIVNLGRGEGIMPIKEQIPREKFRQGERVRCYVVDVQQTPRGPQILLSRNSEEFLKGLFALEVPEIYERVIEIKALAREPGERSKVAVSSSDDRIDPVGACVGIKGVRVQAIVRELNNERIDIVPWTSNSEVFVTRALAPAKVVAIDVFDAERKMTVAVEDEKLSLAIGRNGQNARLASKLTGWKVNILSETEYDEMKRREAEMLLPVGQVPGIGIKIRDRLIEHDINTVQRLAQTTVETLEKIEGIGERSAETLIDRAKEMVTDLEAEYEQKEEAARAEAAAEAEAESSGETGADERDLESAEDEPRRVEEPVPDRKLTESDIFSADTDQAEDGESDEEQEMTDDQPGDDADEVPESEPEPHEQSPEAEDEEEETTRHGSTGV